MLAFLGALVPVLASLWVGAGTLRDLSKQSHNARVAERLWAQYNLDRGAIEDTDPKLGEKNKVLTDRRMWLLEANGVDPMIGTIKALNKSVMPAPPSPKEFHRQWILIFGAVIGVVLVAVQVGLDSLP